MKRIVWILFFAHLATVCNCQTLLQLASEQRTIATDALNKYIIKCNIINNLKIEIQEVFERIEQIKKQLSGINELERRIIAEMKTGYFCDQCWNTKTQIESKGEAFLTHIKRVKGKIVAAPPDKIKEKSEEFADMRISLNRELKEKMALLVNLKGQLTDAYFNTDKLPLIWEQAIIAEDGYRLKQWALQKQELEQQKLQNSDKQMNLQFELQRLERDTITNRLLIMDYKYNLEITKQKDNILAGRKSELEYQQKLDKSHWIKLVIEEKQQLHNAMALIGGNKTFFINSLAGEYDYNMQYDVDMYNGLHKIGPEYQAPIKPIPNNSKDIKNYLEKLGKKNQ